MSYNLRSTSYFGHHLDRELTKRGARTSGSTERKQARLQRFLEVENQLDTLRQVVKTEQRIVQERGERRAAQMIIEAADKVWAEKGPEGVEEIIEMLRACSPRVRDLVRGFVGL
jgi:hypothetical protein